MDSSENENGKFSRMLRWIASQGVAKLANWVIGSLFVVAGGAAVIFRDWITQRYVVSGWILAVLVFFSAVGLCTIIASIAYTFFPRRRTRRIQEIDWQYDCHQRCVHNITPICPNANCRRELATATTGGEYPDDAVFYCPPTDGCSFRRVFRFTHSEVMGKVTQELTPCWPWQPKPKVNWRPPGRVYVL